MKSIIRFIECVYRNIKDSSVPIGKILFVFCKLSFFNGDLFGSRATVEFFKDGLGFSLCRKRSRRLDLHKEGSLIDMFARLCINTLDSSAFFKTNTHRL
ncbi:MAG: hypothetical protein HY228_01190 [Candidatus Yonathbacteria bacterium]|nr:hypothetical protein [Candidatus Yonathbacteria bacterium]